MFCWLEAFWFTVRFNVITLSQPATDPPLKVKTGVLVEHISLQMRLEMALMQAC